MREKSTKKSLKKVIKEKGRASEEDHLVKSLLTYLATLGAVESRVRDAFLLRLATFTF